MAYCKTPPFLEGASLSQVEIEKLTCTEVSHDTDGDEILQQINNMYSDILDNFTMMNSSSKVRFSKLIISTNIFRQTLDKIPGLQFYIAKCSQSQLVTSH